MTVLVASVDLFLRKYTTQREIISKINLTGFSLRHLGMVVTIVTIISLTPLTVLNKYEKPDI
jgi:hypothetical protein